MNNENKKDKKHQKENINEESQNKSLVKKDKKTDKINDESQLKSSDKTTEKATKNEKPKSKKKNEEESAMIENVLDSKSKNKKDEAATSQENESKKPKKLIFSLTSYQDIMVNLILNKSIEKEKKHISGARVRQDSSLFSNLKTEKTEMTSQDIIDLLHKENIYLTNEEIVLSLLKISKLGMNKQGEVCREVINAIKSLISNNEESKMRFSIISKFIEIVYKLTDTIGGLHNSLKFVKNIIEKTQNKNINTRSIIFKLDEFINTKINTKEYISNKHGINLIKENDNILIYGKSQIFRNILFKAAQKGVNFKVVYVDNRQSSHIKSEIEFLSKLGVNVVYSYLNGISGIIDKVTKVFVKAKSMLSNGSLLSDVGTSLIACIANNFKKPVITFCETYKFWDKILMNSFQSNNLNIESITENSSNFNKLNILYDITPANYINMVVCEHGYIPPTSVPVVIREFEKEEVEFD